MPYKCESILLGEYDRRRKLTDEQKETILHLYKTTKTSCQKLANQFNVSKSTILIIVNPDRRAAVKDHVKKHWKDYQSSKKDHAYYMRETRHYKQKLYLEGKLEK